MSHSARPVILISALHYEWRTLEEAFDRCLSEFGLDGIELSVHEGAGRPHLLEPEYDRVAELSAACALTVSAHAWGDLPQMGAAGAVAQLRRWLALCARMSSRYLVVHGGAHEARETGLALMAAAFGTVAEEYEAAGVVLCIENHYAWDYCGCHELYGTAGELEALFAQVPSPGLGFCLDYGHSHMNGNTFELLQRVGRRLAYAHLADNLGEHDDHLMFGKGTVPWRDVLTATRDAGFPGPFTVEFPVRESIEGLRRCVEMVSEGYGGEAGSPGERVVEG